jgi:CHAT domain-containing protein/Tfp pilus assembly protein PilF
VLLCVLFTLTPPTSSFSQLQSTNEITNENSLIAVLVNSAEERQATDALLDTHPTLVTSSLWEKMIIRASSVHYLKGAEKSLGLYGIALKIAVRLRDGRRIATTHYKIGQTYSGIGKVEAAIQSLLDSKAAFENTGLRRDVIYILSDLGSLHFYASDYKQARAYAQQCLALAERLRGGGDPPGALPDDFGVASAWATLGALSRYEGNYPLAIEQLRKAIGIYEQLNQGTLRFGFNLADNITELSRVYSTLGDHVQALEHLNQALALAKRLPQRDMLANVLNSIGVLYLEQEDYDKAGEHLRQSLQIYQASGNQSETARVLLNLGVTEQRRGNIDQALESFRRSLETATAAANKDVKIAAGEGLGVVYREKREFTTAFRLLDQALLLAKEIEDQTRIAELLWRKAEVFYAMGNFGEAAALSGESLQLARRLRLPKHSYLAATLVGKALLKKKQTVQAHQLLSEAIEQIETMRESVAGQEQERQLYFEDKVSAYHLMIDLLFTENRISEAVLCADRAKGRVLLDVVSGGIQAGSLAAADLSRLVPDHKTALIEYVVTPERVYLFILTKRVLGQSLDIHQYAIPIDQSELYARVTRFYQMIAANNPGFGLLSRELYDLLIKPAADQLRGKTTIYVIPDGVLWNVPFQALQDHAGRYLIEGSAISYAPSINVLKEIKQRRQPNSDLSSLLAFANPVTVAVEIKKGEAFGPLPQAETEVRKLAQFFAPHRRHVFAGPAANERAFKSLAASSGIIHFATHGMIYNQQPLYSYLLLSNTDAEDDGLLEAREIMKLKLRADLVVLSACETAGGRIGAGEGVIGISWAFFVAGCRTTVVSQWKVNSTATSELMASFYQYFKKARPMPKANALRLAALRLLNDERYRHPFYWAGFIIVGDG